MKNVGNIDRLIRILLAFIGTTLFFTGTVTGVWGWVVVALSGIFLVTALISFCPLYAIFKVSSCKK